MSKYTKVIAALGVAAGLGVASLPLGAFAATQYTRTGTVEVELTVPDSLIVKIDDEPAAGIAAGATQAGDKIEFGLVPAGTSKAATAHTVISVASSAANSYTLTAAGTDLATTENGGDTIAPFSTAATALSNDGTNGGWGIKVTANNDLALDGASTFGTGYYMPETAEVVDSAEIAADNTATPNAYTIEYGANVATGKKAGTYTGTATYVVTSPNN